MSNSKTSSAPKAATKKAAPQAGANRPQQAQAASQQGQPIRRPSTVEEAIAKAQHGRVNVTPAKAIEMAGQLYARRQYAQAERVCRQIINARPGNADAHNILGVSLAALGNSKDAVSELKRAIKINAQAPSYHSNLGEILRQDGKLNEASEVLEAAIKLDPNNAQALNNLGIIQYEKRAFAK